MKTYRWKGIFYKSVETCRVNQSGSAIIAESEITGSHNAITYRVAYRLRATPEWNPHEFEMTQTVNDQTKNFHAFRTPSGWLINGQPDARFDACSDIDLSISPLTNTFPINRLDFSDSHVRHVNVLYIDVLNDDIRATQQRYMRKSSTIYNFQTVPKDFEANIEVDSDGFVTLYPELFQRL